MLAAIILSAGASSRMGRPKALLPYREGTFLEHLIQVTRHPRVGVTRVVLGSGAEDIRTIAKLSPHMVVLNPNWQQGQLSSICEGIRSLEGMATDGIVLCPVDHPLVSASLVGDLIGQFYSEGKAIVLPTTGGAAATPSFSQALCSVNCSQPLRKRARARLSGPTPPTFSKSPRMKKAWSSTLTTPTCCGMF